MALGECHTILCLPGNDSMCARECQCLSYAENVNAALVVVLESHRVVDGFTGCVTLIEQCQLNSRLRQR